jgi:hypothetical protein
MRSPRLHCQTCHREIRELVASRSGYHGKVVNHAKGDVDCARCHTEHYGLNFSIIRWPTSKDEFDHKTTGYALVGHHASLHCEQCHNPSHISPEARKKISMKDVSRTFEGLNQQCLTCHQDRHAGQLGTDCGRCHNESQWKPAALFDHSRAQYPLTGRHEQVPCAKCHQPMPDNAKVIRYKNLNFADCNGCHQDPHHGAFAARCESCHNTGNWKEVHVSNSFDHSKTKFPLAGKHAGLACQKCHKDANFKDPVAHDKCMDCHKDQHKGQFASRADHGECGACHKVEGFKPSTFTDANHDGTAFPIRGKHVGVPCAKCHTPAGLDTNYHPASKACLDCHRDPHGAQFAGPPHANRCEDCHVVDGFEPSTFTLTRHQTTTFALNGAHAATACHDCHKKGGPNLADRQYHFARHDCKTCHKDPHQDEFPTPLRTAAAGHDLCESCHELRSWHRLKPFDHVQTGFQLKGAHAVLACGDCHRRQQLAEGVAEIRFKGAPEVCAGCHEDIHNGQFQRGNQPADCARCHESTRWLATLFDHNRSTSFPLTGSHADVPCRLCHFKGPTVNGRVIVQYHNTPTKCSACHR